MLCRKNAIFLFIRFYSRGQRWRCGIIMKISYLRWAIEKGQLDSRFASLYGADAVEWQRRRYIRALDRFAINFGDGREDRNVRVYSVSGRSEISGNHTDHNGGCIIGCAIDLDLIAVVSAREDGVIELRSEGFEPDIVRVGDGAAYPRFSSASLISGIAEQIAERGYTVGGFDAYTVSSVYKGSGLSSSAAFEDAVGLIINDMFCDGALSPLELAIISQRAERDYFGKACGLMDQAVCAVGGLVSLDFADESDPKVTQLCPNLDGLGLCMCITNTGGQPCRSRRRVFRHPRRDALGRGVLRSAGAARTDGGADNLGAACASRGGRRPCRAARAALCTRERAGRAGLPRTRRVGYGCFSRCDSRVWALECRAASECDRPRKLA